MIQIATIETSKAGRLMKYLTTTWNRCRAVAWHYGPTGRRICLEGQGECAAANFVSHSGFGLRVLY